MRKKIAILFLGDFFYDARVINMAVSLNGCYSVTILSCFKKKINSSLFDKINFHQIKIKTGGWIRYLEYHHKASSYLKNKNFDFIVSGDLYSLSAACLNKKNNKIIYDCREIYTALSPHINKPIYSFLCYLYEKSFLKFVDDVIVTAQTDLSFLKKKYFKYSFLKWHTIYNYPLRYRVQTKNIREQHLIPNNQIILLYQGCIHRGRGLSQLIRLTSMDSNITSIIIGGGIEKKYYQSLSQTLKVSNKIIFIDKVPYLELFGYSAACDIGWSLIKDKSLSYKYALPNKLFEYLFSGLPVVASPLINIKNIMKNYDIGSMVSYGDTKEQLSIVKNLMMNKKNKSYYTNIAIKNFIWDVQNDLFLKIFKKE